MWGMPGAVAHAGLADAILPLGRVPDVINRLAASSTGRRHPSRRRPMTVSPQPLRLGRASSCARSAIVLQPGKEYLVEARLLPIARAARASPTSTRTSSRCAPAPPRQPPAVVEALTTNETSWFRDCDAVHGADLDGRCRRCSPRAAPRRLQIWSAACSSGQEPYTIAMTLDDCLPAVVSRRHQRDRPVPGDARQAPAGRYSQLEVNRGLPAAMFVRHFSRAGAEWEIPRNCASS